MSGKNRKYDRENLLEIGSQYVRSGKSVRELAKEYGVSRTVVSKAKGLYLAFQEGKQAGKDQKKREMEGKVNRLEERVERLSSPTRETNDDSEVDLHQ